GGVFNGVAALVEESDERLAFEPSPQLGLFDPGRRSSAAAASSAASAPAPDFLAEPHDGRRSRWLWALAALLAAVAVGVQVTYRFRAELAASSPEASKALRTVCQPLGCDVPLPRRPDLMSIDSSEPHAGGRLPPLSFLSAMTLLVTGSIAYDTIMVFPDRFRNHLLADQLHILNVCFLTPEMRREFGGTAGNIAYNLKLLGEDPLVM